MNKKILVVDDEPISLAVISDFLSSEGYELVKAENGQQAFDILKACPTSFSVLVLDRLMPYMSGLELVKLMQRNIELAKIPVIMLTGMGEKEDIIDAVDAGVFDYLTKPVEKNLLVDMVKRALDAAQ